MSQQNALWLVKTGGQIIGPFTSFEIEERLRKRELVLLDEVCLPFTRWSYIRETEKFSEVVEEIRQHDLENLDNETQTDGVFTDEITQSVTEPIAEAFTDEITDEISGPPQFGSEKTQEITYDDVPEVPYPQGERKRLEKTRHYGSAAQVEKEVKPFSKMLWVLSIVFVLATFTWMGFNYIFVQQESKKLAYAEYTKRAFDTFRAGKFEESIDYFGKAYEINPKNEEIYIYYGILLVNYANETVEGKRLLNQVLDFDETKRQHALNGIGIANLVDGELRIAESNMQQALKVDPNYTPAMINLAVTKIYKREFQQANELLRQSIVKGSRDKIPSILIASNYINLALGTKDASYFKQAEENLIGFIRTNLDYKQEALFLLAYIKFQMQDKEGFIKYAKRLLSLDPDLTERHRHEEDVYHGLASWVELGKKCDQIKSNFVTDIHLHALKVFCKVKSGQHENARKLSEELLAENPQHPLLLAMHSYVLKHSGLDQASIVMLGRSVEANRDKKFIMPFILQGWFCIENRDWNCAEKNWLTVLNKDPDSLAARVNLARIDFEKGNLDAANNKITVLFDRAKEYIPYYQLNADFEERANSGEK